MNDTSCRLLFVYALILYGLVTPYGDKYLCQRLRKRIVALRYQANARTSVILSSVESCGILMMKIVKVMPYISFLDMSLKID